MTPLTMIPNFCEPYLPRSLIVVSRPGCSTFTVMTSPLHSSYIPRMKWVQTEAYRQVVAMWVVRFREEINAVAFVRLFASHPVFLRDKHLFACRRCQRIRGRWLVVVFFF